MRRRPSGIALGLSVLVFLAGTATGALARIPNAGELPGHVATPATVQIAASVTRPECDGCPPPASCDGCWQPPADARWQIQLQGVDNHCDTGGINVGIHNITWTGSEVVTPVIFAIDLYVDDGPCPEFQPGTLATVAVDALHSRGAKVIAYIDAGTWEAWRPDRKSFVDFDRRCGGCLLGDALSSSADERWLNINNSRGQRRFLLGLMKARIDKAVEAGFDAVFFDNQEEWRYAEPFRITARSQIVYLTKLLNIAHQAGLAAGPNNDILQDELFEPYADFQINEQCFRYRECFHMNPMSQAGKPIFEIEYRSRPMRSVCVLAIRRGYNTIRKNPGLFDDPWRACR